MVSADAWDRWRDSLASETARASLAPEPAPEPKPSKRTLRVIGIPKSLLSHQPSSAEKCRLEGRCRMCGRSAKVRQLTQHHVVPLEWWRDIALEYRSRRNVNANIVPLCRPCHDEVDHWSERRLPARSMLRRTMSQQEVAFAIACAGLPWVEENYPLTWVA